MSHSIAPRLLVCLVAASVVTSTAFYCRIQNPERITLGTIAMRTGNHDPRPVHVSNVAGRTQHGQFIICHSSGPLHYPVVFRLTVNSPLPDSCLDLAGRCRGVQLEALAGCPIAPPFVLIDGAKPDDLKQ